MIEADALVDKFSLRRNGGAGIPDGTYSFGQLNGTTSIVENGVASTPDNTGFASSTARTSDLVLTMVQRAGA